MIDSWPHMAARTAQPSPWRRIRWPDSALHPATSVPALVLFKSTYDVRIRTGRTSPKEAKTHTYSLDKRSRPRSISAVHMAPFPHRTLPTAPISRDPRRDHPAACALWSDRHRDRRTWGGARRNHCPRAIPPGPAGRKPRVDSRG